MIVGSVAAGLWGLFGITFLSATLLPMASEAAVVAMVVGGWSKVHVLLVATAGNTLGGMFNYGLGRWAEGTRAGARLRKGSARWLWVQGWAGRYGAWAGLLCWLPVVGDPLALALGVLRTAWLPTLVAMAVGKGLRYALLIGLFG